jgi:hypothetical protein
MTGAQVRAAAGAGLQEHDLGAGCKQFVPPPFSMFLPLDARILLSPPTNRVVGIDAPGGCVTDTGIGIGSTREEIRRAYASRKIVEQASQGGQVLRVQGPSSWLGFVFGDGTIVRHISVGTHDFAAQYELCAGPRSS